MGPVDNRIKVTSTSSSILRAIEDRADSLSLSHLLLLYQIYMNLDLDKCKPL